MDDNPQAWLLLSLLPQLGSSTLVRLRAALGSAEAILQAPRQQLLALGLRRSCVDLIALWLRNPEAHPLSAAMDQVDRWLCVGGRQLIGLDDRQYPPQLAAIADPPPVLYVLGDPELLSQPQIAIVGSRNASVSGLENAECFSRQLSLSGLIPVSGLALGVDGRAHQGALEGLGLTVAVLGTGIDRVYPARHRWLAEKILAQGGTLVSEFPLGTPPRAGCFPRRNRIISGLSLGVLVVEASPNSGSLITARCALEQGRELFAMPGSIHNPVAKGCHELIRRGAKLVETVAHVLEEVGPQIPRAAGDPLPVGEATDLDELGQRLLEATGYEPTSVDLLVERSDLSPDRVLSGMLELELVGLVLSVPGGFQRA